MTRALVRREVSVAAPARRLWDYVTDWPRQGEWIPFTRVEEVAHAHRVGGRIRAWTGLGRVGFWDPMTITAWEDHLDEPDGWARCEVLHTGRVVRGEAEFAVRADGPAHSLFTWWEHLVLPAGSAGALAWRAGGQGAERAVGAALDRLARRVERESAARHTGE
jgi:hypothetical protein